jgi:hypothetical protein
VGKSSIALKSYNSPYFNIYKYIKLIHAIRFQSDDSTTLGCTEVRVEPRVLFRLELPSKKSIGVKAKPAKLAKDVLGPILSQYGWNLDLMTVRRESDQQPVDLSATVASIDNCRLVVLPRSSTEIRCGLDRTI